jgi:hypothetical protein
LIVKRNFPLPIDEQAQEDNLNENEDTDNPNLASQILCHTWDPRGTIWCGSKLGKLLKCDVNNSDGTPLEVHSQLKFGPIASMMATAHHLVVGCDGGKLVWLDSRSGQIEQFHVKTGSEARVKFVAIDETQTKLLIADENGMILIGTVVGDVLTAVVPEDEQWDPHIQIDPVSRPSLKF